MRIRTESGNAGSILIVAVVLVVAGCGGDDDEVTFPTDQPVPEIPGPEGTGATTTTVGVGPDDTGFTPITSGPDDIFSGVVAQPIDELDTILGSGEVANLGASWLESYGMVTNGVVLDRKDRPIWFAPQEVCTYLPGGLLAVGADADIAQVISLAGSEFGVELIDEDVVLDNRADLDFRLTRLSFNDAQRRSVDPYFLVTELRRTSGFPDDIVLDVEHVSFTAQRYMFGPGDAPTYQPLTAAEKGTESYRSPQTDVFVAVVDTGWGQQGGTRGPTGYDGHLLPDLNDDLSSPGPRDGQLRPDGSFPIGVFGHGDVVGSIINGHTSATMIWTRAGVNAPLETDLIQAIALALGEAMTASGDGTDVPLIINLSLGTYACNGQPPAALEAIVREIVNDYPRTVIVAAAGNDHVAEPWYPAGFADDHPGRVVSVGALATAAGDLQTDDGGIPAEFSNHGCVTTWAPGVDVAASQWHDSLISAWSGTSMAAAWVSGTIAGVVETLVANGEPPDPVLALDKLISEGRIGNGGCGPHGF